MASAIKKVILIGAGGNVGQLLLQALIDSSAIEVSVLSRLSSTSTFPESVRVHKIEYSEAALVKAFHGQDAVISAAGGSAILEQKTFIDAAIKAGVKRFFPSEFSVNTLDPGARDLVPIFQQKKEILDYLHAKEEGGLTWTGIAVGLLFDWGLKAGILQFDLTAQSAVVWDSGNTPFATTTVDTMGCALISALQRPSETANKYLHVTSFVPTQHVVLAALEKATAKTWDVKKTTTDVQVKTGRDLLQKGDFNGLFPLLQASSFGHFEGRGTKFAEEESADNQLLDLPAEDLDTVVRAVVKT